MKKDFLSIFKQKKAKRPLTVFFTQHAVHVLSAQEKMGKSKKPSKSANLSKVGKQSISSRAHPRDSSSLVIESFDASAKNLSAPQPARLSDKFGNPEIVSRCHDFRISRISPQVFLMTYVREDSSRTFVIAQATHIYDWRIISESSALATPSLFQTSSGASSIVAPTYNIRRDGSASSGNFLLFRDGLFVQSAQSQDLSNWTWDDSFIFTSRARMFDASALTILGSSVSKKGVLLFYDVSEYKSDIQTYEARVGAILLDAKDPNKILWRSGVPVWQAIIVLASKIDGRIKKVAENIVKNGAKNAAGPLRPVGMCTTDKEHIFCWVDEDGSIVSGCIPIFITDETVAIDHKPILKKSHANPIIEPHAKNAWENAAVFNPAALYKNGKVHLLYRAIGDRGISVLGYASSEDGINFDERLDQPAYYPRMPFEGSRATGPTSYTAAFASGGGWGGSEDPKIVEIDGTIYLTYVAFSGWSEPRIALSTISTKDFLKKKWTWTTPQLMSPPGVIDKSACLLPEKYKGKFVVFHRIFPDILIDFVDDLDFSDGKWLKGEYRIKVRPGMWDGGKISVGAPPIKTDKGWLLIYHAIDEAGVYPNGGSCSGLSQYKVGAMLLDLKDPRKVLHRTNQPILVPDMPYENDGKPGVAYPCGAVVVGDGLFVYYGGGDKVVCVATAPLNSVLKHLEGEKPIKMHKASVSL